MEHFKDTVKMKDNRYHISWPWRKKNFTLPQNYELLLED